MKTKTIIFLWVLLTVVSTTIAHAQTTESFTFTTNRLVPDGSLSGMSDVQRASSTIGNITSLKVRLKVTGEFNGDLYCYLRHSGRFVVLINRPGKTAANPFGYGDSGLDITFDDAATNGDLHGYQSVTIPADGFPLTGIWQPDDRNADPDIVTDESPRSTSLADLNGLNASGNWTLYLVDTESGATNVLTEWGLDITGGTQTLTWNNPGDIIYGTALNDAQLNAAATFNSTPISGTYSYTPPVGTVLNAGSNQTLSVVFTPDDTNSFHPITNSVTINVQPAPLTITANDTNTVYGADLPTLTATYSGFVAGDDTNSLTSLATVATAATSTSDAGAYPITASGAASQNYSFNYVDGTLTIVPSSSSAEVVSSANPAVPGTSVTFTATLSAVAPGVGLPDGIVQFRIDGEIAGSGNLSGGVATFSTTSLPVGIHTVAAEFAGSLNFTGTTNSLTPNQVINTPPVAGNDTLERFVNGGVKVRVEDLLTNDTDADGDPLTITVSSNSVGGGTITLSGDWVIYTPAVGFTNADSFTYTIADGRGGSAVATVTVAIKVDDLPTANLSITYLGGNQYRIDGSGIPGRTYRLQYSDTAAPFTWQDMANGSLTADEVGMFEYTDTSGGNLRFYRTVTP